jgi:xanthine dehydrogenase small subunit
MDALLITLNGEACAVQAPPTTTLLDWLRGRGLGGTKEGCAEGDCGACTVVIEAGGERRPVNACLCIMGQLHGRAVRTIEGLGAAHPLVRALAESDATQCGFCTPGIAMAAWAHTRAGGDQHEALAGNLCRCTGYRPILDAMSGLMDDGVSGPDVEPPRPGLDFGGFHLPASLAEALALRAAHPAAWVLAGGTDLGLRFAEHREHPARVICLRDVAEMQGVGAGPEGLRLGAAASYEEWLRACRADPGFAPLAPFLSRLGSRQIRALGSVGGNLGTASPIGDALPVLLALDATVELAGPRGTRRLPVGTFLAGYRRNALAPDELIVAVDLPRPPPGALLAAEKLSRRYDQDISAVSLAACVELDGGVVTRARLAFGGMADRALRVPEAEAVLLHRPLDDAALREAGAALRLSPLSDHRAGATYRLDAARGLLRRLALRHAGLAATVHEA